MLQPDAPRCLRRALSSAQAIARQYTLTRTRQSDMSFPRQPNPGALLLSILLLGCTQSDRRDTGSTDGSVYGGTLIVAIPAEPATLFPPTADASQEFAVINSVYDRLAEIGDHLETVGDRNFKPRLASSWAWSDDSLSIAFTVDSAARWHDGVPVSAEDLRYSFSVYRSDSLPSIDPSLLANIDSVSVRDPRTAVFWFRQRTPQQFYEATNHIYILPSHLLASIPISTLPASPIARNPVGTGRFRFREWVPGQRLEIIADTLNWRGRAMLDRVIWSIAPDYDAATVKLFAGEADFFEYLRPGDIPGINKSPNLKLVDNNTLQYYFLGFNMHAPGNSTVPHPVFSDARVRRALSMAVDRAAMVANTYDSLGMVALGPAPRALIPDTNAFRQISYDPSHAAALLDSAGWRDSNGDGIRERDGQQLSFGILVPNSSAARRTLATLMQEQFRAVGVKVTPLVLDVVAFSNRTDNGRFDSYMGGWASSPGLTGTRQTWGSGGSGNAGGYSSAVFDADVDSALTTFDVAASHNWWARAFQQIIDDAPAIWLSELRAPVVVHKRFILPALRADGWYADLADWKTDPALRLPRDLIGLGATAAAQVQAETGSAPQSGSSPDR